MIIVELPIKNPGWTQLYRSGFPIGGIWGSVSGVTALRQRWLIAIRIGNDTSCLIDADKISMEQRKESSHKVEQAGFDYTVGGSYGLVKLVIEPCPGQPAK